jgi:hypothetical protein
MKKPDFAEEQTMANINSLTLHRERERVRVSI